ncbi:MAG: LysR family transcriptional regulator [Clostridia bacterium]|nr:LysR family transcriptional regulator [Clostridia bacterium]
MDLHLLENIVCIADEKSITRAAEKRFVTQSALNQQLQKLEEELGTPLFIRTRSNWLPTPAGEAYLTAARQMLTLKKDTYVQIADYAERSSRHLAVGLIPERGVDMFTAIYPAFHAAFPQMQVEPVECRVTAMQRMITAGQLDLGLATLTEDQRDGNVYHLMGEEEIVLAVPAGHTLAEGGSADCKAAPETDLSRFSQEPFVRIYQQSTLYALTERLFSQAGFTPRVLFSTASNLSKYRIVSLGLGCALLPAVYALRDGSVVYFRLPSRPRWQITLCSRRDGYLGKAERTYLALCREYWKNKEKNAAFAAFDA